MKVKPEKIRFFSPQKSEEKVPEETAPKQTTFSTTVTKTGRLAFPQKLMEGLGIDPSKPNFKVGTTNRRKGVKALYLIPTGENDSESFSLTKTGRGYSIPLKGVFQQMGLDFADQEFVFTIKPFDYAEGVTGFELVSDQPNSRTNEAV